MNRYIQSPPINPLGPLLDQVLSDPAALSIAFSSGFEYIYEPIPFPDFHGPLNLNNPTLLDLALKGKIHLKK
jgi:hypothetical protein